MVNGYTFLLSALSDLRAFTPSSGFWWQVAALVGLIVLSGFFSGSEIAIFRLSKTRRRHLVDEGVRGSKVIDALMRRPNRVLITILIGNNLVNIASASLATVIALDIFGSTGIGIATGVMTFAILVFGEITPKAYASRHSQQVSLRVARPLRTLQLIFLPITIVLEFITDALFRLFGAKRTDERTFMSSDEIRTLIDMGTEEGVLEEDEQEMIHGVISFGELMAKEVMVPRTDLVCLAANATLKDAVDVANKSGYSRLPVYEGNQDNVIGVLYAKDLLKVLSDGQTTGGIRDLLRECVYIPQTNTLDDVLTELQDKRVHLAVVVDEYGGTSGIVTMEDLLEEIVGEIFDEYDRSREAIRPVNENVAFVDARVHVDDVNEALGTDIPEDEAFETIGGFVYQSLGRLAEEGEEFEAHGVRVRIEKVSNRRILRVKIRRVIPVDEEG